MLGGTMHGYVLSQCVVVLENRMGRFDELGRTQMKGCSEEFRF